MKMYPARESFLLVLTIIFICQMSLQNPQIGYHCKGPQVNGPILVGTQQHHALPPRTRPNWSLKCACDGPERHFWTRDKTLPCVTSRGGVVLCRRAPDQIEIRNAPVTDRNDILEHACDKTQSHAWCHSLLCVTWRIISPNICLRLRPEIILQIIRPRMR